MTTIHFLHLTDLHMGAPEQNYLWPRIREEFFNDLRRLHDKCGPWDLVLFTGDLTYRGQSHEFDMLNEFLINLWKELKNLGSSPKLLAVPGNHDLVRPENNPHSKYSKTDYINTIELITENIGAPSSMSFWQRFWSDEECIAREIVNDAFANYLTWWNSLDQQFKPDNYSPGILPGDFSCIFKKGDAELGIVGLNSSFRHLTSTVEEGSLSLDVRQFQAACQQEQFKDAMDWCKDNHTCLLMTHHPPKWLEEASRIELQREILAKYFSLHLCGHMHELESENIEFFGNPSLLTWSGRSLFGLEYVGDEQQQRRSHGYTVVRIDFIPNTMEGRLFFLASRSKRIRSN